MSEHLVAIKNYCTNQKIKLSQPQELIVGIIATCQFPPTASMILKILSNNNPKANRMTIHRALEYLISCNLVHRIARNHTYALCANLNQFHQQSCQIIICQNCGSQREIHSHKICEALNEVSLTHNFMFKSPLEISGICYNCQNKL